MSRARRWLHTGKDSAFTFGKTLAFAWQAGPVTLILLLLLQGLQGVIPLGTAWITKILFDLLARNFQRHQFSWTQVLWLLVAQGIVYLLGQLIAPTTNYLSADLGRRLTLNVKQNVYRKLNTIEGLASFEDPTFHNTIEAVSRSVEFIPSQTLTILMSLLQCALTLLTFFGVLIELSPWLVLIVGLSVVPQFLVQMKFGRQRFQLLFRNSAKERRASYYGQLLSWIAYAKEVRLFQVGEHFLQKFLATTREIHQSQRQQQYRELLWQLLLGFISSLATAGAFLLALFQAFTGGVSIGDIALYLNAVTSVQSSLGTCVLAFSQVNTSILFYRQYEQLMTMKQPLTIAHEPRSMASLQAGITLRDVSFRYSDQHPWILRHVNLFIPVHRCLALVGLNGAGKTTLVKLLTRLYDPTEGAIFWDEYDIREFDPHVYRQHIGAIFQDFARYDFSAYENISLGNIDLSNQEEIVYQAAKKAGIHERIEALPDSYQSILSRWLAEDQDGTDLSGGEWQKLALARMFMRDADLLILDEPTAALDAQAEYDLYQQFRYLMQGHTSILITHRFSTIRMADEIAVLERGTIKEVGTHDELQAKNGLYAQLYHMQAENYQL